MKEVEHGSHMNMPGVDLFPVSSVKIQASTVEYSTVKASTVQYSTVQKI